MSKADKMFEELGYKKEVNSDSFIRELSIKGHFNVIQFFKEIGVYSLHLKLNQINIKEHIAIHEKMKELGWLND